ncbi:MAG: GxxExxY protein [bacterium]
MIARKDAKTPRMRKGVLFHEKQILTYLQQTGNKLGLLLNFNVPVMKDGIHRVVMGLEE